MLISGGLHAKSSAGSFSGFIKKKWVRICIPLYIVVFVDCILCLFVNNNLSITKIIPYLLNIQGLGFIFPDLAPWFGRVTQGGLNNMGMGHTWFLTVIFFCYIMWWCIVKLADRKDIKRKHIYIIISVILFVLDIGFAYMGIELRYFLCFFIGCVIGCLEDENKCPSGKNLRYVLTMLSMIAALALRLITRKFFDGTCFYNSIVVGITHIILAVWIFETCKFPVFKRISTFAIFEKAEEFSFYIYLCHYMFLSGLLSVGNWNCSLVLQLAGFAVLAVILSVIVKWLDSLIKKFGGCIL